MDVEDERRQLDRIVADLTAEFPGLPGDEVRRRFDALVNSFHDAPVRTFVPVLVGREVRAQLRRVVQA